MGQKYTLVLRWTLFHGVDVELQGTWQLKVPQSPQSVKQMDKTDQTFTRTADAKHLSDTEVKIS